MDSRKIIILSYTGAGFLAWFLSRSFVQWLQISFYQVRMLPGKELLREALPLVIGIGTFVTLLKLPGVNIVMDEAISELKKVTWPNRDEVVKATWVVLFCIVIISALLAGFDLVWGKMINYLLS